MLVDTVKFLQLIKDNFLIPPGPFEKGNHCLLLENNKLILSINRGSHFQNFSFEEKDLNKTPKELLEDIKKILDAQV